MTGSGDARRFADSLHALKQRSGLSYAELARRTYTTSSTLHHYCTGAGLPRDHAIVIAVAKECGAAPDELNALLGHWTAAAADDPRGAVYTTAVSPQTTNVTAPDVKATCSTPAEPSPGDSAQQGV
jgi:hypothetical protein